MKSLPKLTLVFVFSLVVLLSETLILSEWMYTGIISIISVVFFVIEKLKLFSKADRPHNESLQNYLIYKFNDIKFLRNLIIIIWFLIVGMVVFHYSSIAVTANESTNMKTFAGIIWNENNEPLESVIVFLPEYNKYDTTNDFGKFEFYIQSDNEITVSIIAKKDGYHTYD